ncbi:hypothetical protein KC335_g32 [Hortaea werneckii]|nr:hypothetical protein KC335_g32 [Hortaea werneckii]
MVGICIVILFDTICLQTARGSQLLAFLANYQWRVRLCSLPVLMAHGQRRPNEKFRIRAPVALSDFGIACNTTLYRPHQ